MMIIEILWSILEILWSILDIFEISSDTFKTIVKMTFDPLKPGSNKKVTHT